VFIKKYRFYDFLKHDGGTLQLICSF